MKLQRKDIIKLTITAFMGITIFCALSFISLSQAETAKPANKLEAVPPYQIMKLLMQPQGSPINACDIPVQLAPPETCKPFLNVNEDTLDNLFQNVSSCLDEKPYYYNFSNQDEIILTKPLKINVSDEFKIEGLKLKAGASYPKNEPAIIVFGKGLILKDLQLEGFTTGIIFVSDSNQKNKIDGGKIIGENSSHPAILACHEAPKVENTSITGFSKEIDIIEN